MEKFKEDCCQSTYYFYRSAAKCLVWVCEHYWEELDMKQRDGRASRNCQVLCALHLPGSVRYHIWARVNNTYCSTLVFYISHKFLWTNSILASYTEDSRKQSFYLTTLHRNVKDICKIKKSICHCLQIMFLYAENLKESTNIFLELINEFTEFSK